MDRITDGMAAIGVILYLMSNSHLHSVTHLHISPVRMAGVVIKPTGEKSPKTLSKYLFPRLNLSDFQMLVYHPTRFSLDFLTM
jgi:hypothetical protein